MIAIGALVGLLVPFVPVSAGAQDEKVDEFVKSEMEKQKIPGLSIAVVRNGEVVKAGGYGWANVEWRAPAAAETVFQSGSVGKQFTATLAMMLVEEGKIALDEPVGKYLSAAPEAWKDMTVRHLLTHTSGISNKLYPQINMRQDYTEDQLVEKIASLPLDFPPGTKWTYSNPGYVVLGVLIHKAAGRFYGDLLRERIFGPLGMTTARIINEADIIPNRAAGYRRAGGELKNQEWISPALNTTADGSLYLTVLDLAKWDAALYTEKLLKRESLETMWAPVTLKDGKTRDYGFGWSLATVNGHRFVEHGGAWQGFTAHIARYTGRKLTVIVLTNLAGANPARIAHGIAGLYEAELVPQVADHRTSADAAVGRAAEWLKGRARDGFPPFPRDWEEWWAGNQTYHEIVLYALLASGAKPDQPEVVALLRHVRGSRPNRTYSHALRAMALRSSGLADVRPEIARSGQFLVDTQDAGGGWYWGTELAAPDPGPGALARRTWGKPKPGYGISYTHYALLGLGACAAAGAAPPEDALPLAEKFIAGRQNEDGGWSYGANGKSAGAMTAGSVASLALCLRLSGNRPPLEDPRIRRGIAWLARNYTFDKPHGSIHYYTIHAVETAGSLAGAEKFEDRAWYPEGAAWLLGRQNPDGSWGDGKNPYGKEKFDRILDTAFAILFLRRATASLLIR